MTSPESTLPRRTLLKASAWSIPVIAAAVATPLAAASTTEGYSLTVTTPQVRPWGPAPVLVSLPASAVPIASGTTVLSYQLLSGSGSVIRGGYPLTWGYYESTGRQRLEFFPPEQPQLIGNSFELYFTAPSVWSVELVVPGGTLTGRIEVTDS